MNLSSDKEKIFCHICNKWQEKRTDIYIADREVRCLTCDTLLGYTHDFSDREDFR